MKEILIRVEIEDDIEVSDFEQILLEEGINSINCTYEIIEKTK